MIWSRIACFGDRVDEVDEEGSKTRTVARPNLMYQSRFENNTKTYARLKTEMEQLVVDRGFTVDDYVQAQGRSMKATK